ncbi:bifunctional 4-hydroxy-2-oxoglutarate aldolase/2-dehydro-3-deoxy-phosphogluconate aldolase [Guptibacillus hwajinpoensis]|uniref:bifunctional 4-hydroxy-2-oxoglutarate aldolase/2-dehydro-3-deoxy-phosphogluconate aldolase n=1 Tax=Guptibacillus hwajinpoensis TaxID=208199 RepID=UPI001CD5BD83|nr:bifunctional 4-hydroxy-2-oxoglutarate aldolase/2-dehydro-3-deoxy-phosphogluconate aldolase [Pseudalkalibacillus hwajinpoensis]MCA0991346.1 bifunctional 4-hydroxy-2-oxoglutarate aldolase/2-dehydro-3-deoxy-phosphogluconate aldolase [Pseudalkalibacillus hwajinpoensis]
MDFLKEIKDTGVVAVIRGATPETIIPIAQSLYKGGIKAIEITVETPQVLTMIEKTSLEMGEEVIVGAGTVLDSETARAAIMAGARFIFSPTVNRDTIKVAKRYGIISVPGAMTPTEILKGYEYGADMIKVFPGGTLGPNYLKNIKGPLAHIPLVATGGIDLSNVSSFIKAGATAVGVGSPLVKPEKLVNVRAFQELEERAREFVHEVARARNHYAISPNG